MLGQTPALQEDTRLVVVWYTLVIKPISLGHFFVCWETAL